MDLRNVAILGFVIVLFSSILPWPWGAGITLSLLSYYLNLWVIMTQKLIWAAIFFLFGGLGILGTGAFTITTWQSAAQLIGLIAFPVGIYITYKAISTRSPSVYQGLVGILPGVLLIAAVSTKLPSFVAAEGAYVAIAGGLILELAYFMSNRRGRHYRR